MPLYDHFRSPTKDETTREMVHSQWTAALVRRLNRHWLARDFVAKPKTRLGPEIEIDVAPLERSQPSERPSGNGGQAVLTLPKVWAPPTPLLTMPTLFPDTFEVLVFSTERARRVVGAIELVSSGNKDRETAREAFVSKCMSYLGEGISVVIVDVITDRHFNLHNDLMRRMSGPESAILSKEQHLYAAAYRPVLRDEQPQIDVWIEPCAVGSPLPTMPLRLTADLFVPVELETTYAEACEDTKTV